MSSIGDNISGDQADYGSTGTRFGNHDKASPKAAANSGSVLQAVRTRCSCTCCQKRYLVAVLCCLGLAIVFGARCNSTTATSYFRSHYNETPLRYGNASKPSSQWSAAVIGPVESSFFVGFLITQIPGGIIASRFPASRVLSIVIVASSVLNLFLPLAFNTSFILVMVLRLMQGLLEGCCYPACHGILSHWAPPQDRSRLATLAYSGSYIGIFLGLLLSGLLADQLGWQAPFYFYGTAGILWFCAWQFCVFEKPSVHPCITDEERAYIEVSIGENLSGHDGICDLPWGKFFTSMPVYAIIVANLARNWSFFLLLTQTTKYFDDVFHYPMSMSGFYSSLPHLTMAIVAPIGGQFADELRKRWLSTTIVRKIFNCTGFGMEAAFLLGVGFSSDANVATVCLVIAVSFSGLAVSGYNVNHLDIAPRYASTLMGLSNGIGSLAGILVPVVTVHLVQDHKRESWSKVFLIASLIHFAGVIFYAIFASGEKQDWAEAPADSEDRWRPPTFELATEPAAANDENEADNGSVDGVGLSSESPLFSTVPSLVQTQRH